MRTKTVLLVAGLWLLSTIQAQAAFPSLPGFSKKDSAATTKNADDGGSVFKRPAVLTKMSSGTKRLVTNTKNLITPKRAVKKQKLGTTSVKQASKSQPPQQSLWGRLFDPQPAAPPRTVGEWMALDQPHP